MRILLPAAIAIAVIAAPGAARDRNEVPEATPDGKAQSCVSITSLRESLVRNDRVIDFRISGDR